MSSFSIKRGFVLLLKVFHMDRILVPAKGKKKERKKKSTVDKTLGILTDNMYSTVTFSEVLKKEKL